MVLECMGVTGEFIAEGQTEAEDLKGEAEFFVSMGEGYLSRALILVPSAILVTACILRLVIDAFL